MVSLRLDTACFTSILIECFFFGFYSLLFIIGARLFFSTARGRIPLIVSIPSLLLYVVAAAHVATTIKNGATGFVQIASQGEVDGVSKYFATTVNGTNIANQCLYVINNFLGDSILIWRCWIVWGKNWKIVVVPVSLLFTSAVSGFSFVYDFSKSTNGPFSGNLGIAANIFFVSVFCTNVLVTSVTALRIWRCRKLSAAAESTTDYTGAFNIVVESGAVYSLILCMQMLLYAIGQDFVVVVLYTSMAQITGIAPTGIIVLVLMDRALRYTNDTSASLPSLRGTKTSTYQSNLNSPRRGAPSPINLRPQRSLPHHIQIDIKPDTNIVLASEYDIELESLSKRRPSRPDEIWTPDHEVDFRREF